MDESPPKSHARAVASVRHTCIVIGFYCALGLYGLFTQHAKGSSHPLVEHRGSALPLYLGLMVAEWGLLRYVMVGTRKYGTKFRDLIGAPWARGRDAARDLTLAIGFWALWAGAELAVARLLGKGGTESYDSLLPHGPLEVAAWIALAVSAGICEEAIFRGYLLRQFRAFTQSATLAVIAQALVFGMAHGYQGLRNVVTIAVLGAAFGALALWRKSLRPGMLAHAWMDIIGGLFAR
jgi:hypothetical protein